MGPQGHPGRTRPYAFRAWLGPSSSVSCYRRWAMGILLQVERALERVVEGTSARLFGSNLQPIELARRITREMDLQRTIGVRGLIAPNVFSLALSASDYDRFMSVNDHLKNELIEAARQHAKSANYLFMGPVEVTIERDENSRKGQFLITAHMEERDDPRLIGSIILADGARIDIGEDPLTIGRVGECDIVLSDSNASRRHAEIRREGMYFVITDLGSTNGTKVNGSNIKERKLNNGDQIVIGSTSMTFKSAQE